MSADTHGIIGVDDVGVLVVVDIVVVVRVVDEVVVEGVSTVVVVSKEVVGAAVVTRTGVGDGEAGSDEMVAITETLGVIVITEDVSSRKLEETLVDDETN